MGVRRQRQPHSQLLPQFLLRLLLWFLKAAFSSRFLLLLQLKADWSPNAETD